jgi:hypothetical protein
MPYFTAALCGSMSSAVYSSSGTHTAVPQCKRLYTYRIVRLSFRRRPQGSLTVTLCCIHVVHLNTLS